MAETKERTVSALKAARRRIEDPERWTQGTFARDARGEPTSTYSPKAVCWCARGALYLEFKQSISEGSPAYDLLAEAAPSDPIDREPIAYLNDNGEHADVLALYDRAIELAEARHD